MTDSKARFRRYIEQRKQQGRYYVPIEQLKAQMEFYKSTTDQSQTDNDKVETTVSRT